jgi:hypothetical protein
VLASEPKPGHEPEPELGYERKEEHHLTVTSENSSGSIASAISDGTPVSPTTSSNPSPTTSPSPATSLAT